MEKDSRVVLKNAMIEVRQALKERGFSAKGQTFYRTTKEGNTVLLSVQRSRTFTPTSCEVTVNYGIHSALIASTLRQSTAHRLDIMGTHWRERLNEAGREKWLPIEAADAPSGVAQAICRAIDSVMSELLAHSSNVALRDGWLSGSSPGLTNMQRLLFAAVVVNEYGPALRLPEIVAELRAFVAGGVHQSVVERHLAMANVKV